ncbi:MAG: helix-hairpin-helix domain-containing protein [Amphritea sp.]
MKNYGFLKALLLSCLMILATPLYADGKVNINTATVEQLADGLNGVGENKAKAIVAYREEHGPYASVEDLTQVKGIGAGLLKKNRQVITLTDTEN